MFCSDKGLMCNRSSYKHLLCLQDKIILEKQLHINAQISKIFSVMHKNVCDVIHVITLTWPQGLGVTHSN